MTVDRPVLLLCPVRNSVHELKRSVPTWELIADKIIVADQGSSDGSREYLQSREKVVLIDNPHSEYNEVSRNALLVERARQIHRGALHLTLDADEILSSNVFDSPEWHHFRNMEPGTVGEFAWVQLWKTHEHYLKEPTRYRLAFIDDGRPIEGKKRMHEQRGVGVQNPDRKFIFNEVVCLHYAWVNFQAAIRRNNYYKVYWAMQGARSHHVNNRNHGWYRTVTAKALLNSPTFWLSGYSERGIDVTSIEESALYWWDVEVLRSFKSAGVKKFYPLDIWREVDWEELRKIALAKNIPDVGEQTIIPPGIIRRGFHTATVDGVDILEFLRRAKRVLARKVLP